ncbi:hypothetical protein [Candidatus Clostridium radicumherbarum]|uniref:Uncharacterized protein n=1 Tax=Candidatus Clostridium radicumherbarum TaxID=3381662 RepID=A0ABW8TYZ3_9CLOT
MINNKYPTHKQKDLIAILGEQVLEQIKNISESLTDEYYEKVYGTSKFMDIKENKEVSSIIGSLNRLVMELSFIVNLINKVDKRIIISKEQYKQSEEQLKKDYSFVEQYLILPDIELVIKEMRKELHY